MDDLGQFALIAFTVVFVFVSINIFLSLIGTPPGDKPSKSCDPTHRWYYDNNNTLRCEKCQKTPEQLISEIKSNWP